MIFSSITRGIFTLKRMKMIKELDKSITKASKTDFSLLSDHCKAIQEVGFEVVFKENSSIISLKKEIEGTSVRLDFDGQETQVLTDEVIEKLKDPEHKEKSLKLKEKGANVFLHPFKFWIFEKKQTQVYYCHNCFGECIISTAFVVDNQELIEFGELAFLMKYKPFLEEIREEIHNDFFVKYFDELGVDQGLLQNVSKISEYHYKLLRMKWLGNVRDFIKS